MKQLIYVFAAFLFVTCGKKVAQPEVVEDDIESDNLPVYILLNTEEPRVSANGHISPGQNLVYNIEIDQAMPKDSLELIHDYFIKKGKTDFPGVNKIIVRAYLKGTSIHGIPYASLNLIGTNKETIINEEAAKLEELIEEPTEKASKEVSDAIVGTFFCNRTHDTYVFKSDKTGFFTIQGGSPSEFSWKRSGRNVTIKYEVFGEQKLKFDEKAKTITEKSESFGTLVFEKQ